MIAPCQCLNEALAVGTDPTPYAECLPAAVRGVWGEGTKER